MTGECFSEGRTSLESEVWTTHVFNLRKGKWDRIYWLHPEEAVVCAYYQDQGDQNSWEYDFTVEYGPHQTVFRGDFGAMLDRCPLL
jgi:hypothetical protein